MKPSPLHLDLGTDTLTCTATEVAATFAAMLHEMRAAAPLLHPAERELARQIMAHDSELTVADLFPEFERDSTAHNALRRLRSAQFIRPAPRDRWDRDTRVEVKPFARLVWDRLGEAAIFGQPPAEPEPEPEEPELDLAEPGVNEPAAPDLPPQDEGAEEELAGTGAAPGPAWDEVDIFDFLNDDGAGEMKRAGA